MDQAENSTVRLMDKDAPYRITMTLINISLVLFSVVTAIGFRKTKRTPETVRFLSTALLTFDISGLCLFTVRKFIEDDTLDTFFQSLGICCICLAYITICCMSIERLILFGNSYLYLRLVTARRLRHIVFGVWGFVGFTYFIIRFMVCYVEHPDDWQNPGAAIQRCRYAPRPFYGVLMVITCFVSAACYTKILLIERSYINDHGTSKNMFRGVMKYKGTGIVFLYMMSILVTTIAYGCFILFLDRDSSRIGSDITNMISCAIDPCLYVLWFKECRYEIMKLWLYFGGEKQRAKLEKMRIDIFNIVLRENKNVD